MRIGAPPPPDSTPESTPARTAPGAAPGSGRFGALLAERLQEPRDRIEIARREIRAAIEELRAGGFALPASSAPAAGGTGMAAGAVTYAASAASGGPDPFGWRALARRLGDEIVGPGFGALFEAQIQQESGFDPEVAFGYRKSSAGAEGIAQLMPQYYPGVDRRDPHASLVAAAQTMRHYLAANGGDVRKALASYNAGLGTVQSLVAAHGAQWERGLPAETKTYLAAILGPAAPTFAPGGEPVQAFGGRGPHGVLTPPLDRALGMRPAGDGLALLARGGSTVRAPADGRVASVEAGAGGERRLLLEHGNGWGTSLEGLGEIAVSAGDLVRRGQALGTLAGAEGDTFALTLGVRRDGEPLDPRTYLLAAG